MSRRRHRYGRHETREPKSIVHARRETTLDVAGVGFPGGRSRNVSDNIRFERRFGKFGVSLERRGVGNARGFRR